MTTLKSIAEEAGVSIMTVSNVVNGNHSKVSASTIKKVNNLIEQYNYIPNAAARSLSAKSSKIITLCIPGTQEAGLLQSPYNSNIVSAIEQIINKEGYYLMITSTSDIEEVLSNIKTWNADGAIFLGVSDEFTHYLDSHLSTPFVCIDSYHESNKVINIGSDDFKGGYLAAKYFLNMGHRNIAFASTVEINSNQFYTNKLLYTRFQGFRKALTEFGLDLRKEFIFGADLSYEGGIHIGKSIAEQRDVTAVVSTADIMAAGIIEGARLSGLIVPRDLSVIGYDDLPISSYITPKLTTIRQDIQLKGQLATKILFDLLKEDTVEKNDIVLDVDLIERQSVMVLP